ncbi:MAG: hypothetical protein ABIM73_10025 [Arenimonas sp.]
MTRISAAAGTSPPSIEMNFDDLSDRMTNADVQALFQKLKWECFAQTDNHGILGEQFCSAKVSLVNDVRALRVNYYTLNGKLNIFYVEHTSDAFSPLLYKLNEAYPRSGNTAYFKSSQLPFGSEAYIRSAVLNGEVRDFWGWKAKEGLVVSSNQNRNYRNSVVAFWASNRHMENYLNQTFVHEPGYKVIFESPVMIER